MPNPLRVLCYGLGPIGCEVVRALTRRPGFSIVGAIDIDPAKAGQDVGQVAGLDRSLGVPVSGSLEAALKSGGADVVTHTTGSYLEQVAPQLRALMAAGLNVVSTCEELAYPQAQNPDLARDLDLLAKTHGVTILGTGVNPGYVFDSLILNATATCQEVTAVRGWRELDAGKRRLPLQKKVGAGLSRDEFQQLVDAGKVRHVGLAESVRMVADSLGWPLDRSEEITEGVVAEEDVQTEYLLVKAGQVAGVHQIGRGFSGGREVISLDLKMYVGAKQPRDRIQIEGLPSIDLEIHGGTRGDPATAGIVVNAAPLVIAAAPGLATMASLPPVHYWRG